MGDAPFAGRNGEPSGSASRSACAYLFRAWLHVSVQPGKLRRAKLRFVREHGSSGRGTSVAVAPSDDAALASPADSRSVPDLRGGSRRADVEGTCQLCSQIAGCADRDLVHLLLGGPYHRAVLLESNRFAAMPSVGALTEGHVLLCPRRHVRSFAALSHGEAAEAAEVIDRLARRLIESFGGPVQLFEHGNADVGHAVACSVEHAHLHFLPGVPDLWPAPPIRAEWTEATGITELPTKVCGREYLSLRPADGRWRVAACPPDDNVRSQLLRRHVAALVGRADEWNWREHPAVARLRATVDGLSPYR